MVVKFDHRRRGKWDRDEFNSKLDYTRNCGVYAIKKQIWQRVS